MSDEFLTDHSDPFNEERPALSGRGSEIVSKFAAPTTHRRVGRSILRPPGPAVDDGPSETMNSAEETAEDLGSAVLDSVRDFLKTRRGKDALHTALDNRNSDNRTPEELERLNRTASQLRAENILNVQVFAVDEEANTSIALQDGQIIKISLPRRQKSAWLSGHSSHAIVVVRGLIPVEMVDEAMVVLAGEIEGAAAENHVAVRHGEVLKILRTMAMRYFNDNPAIRQT